MKLEWQKRKNRITGKTLETNSSNAETAKRAAEEAALAAAREHYVAEAAERARALSATELSSVGEALMDFLRALKDLPAVEAAAKACEPLNEKERHVFYGDLVREALIPVEDLLRDHSLTPEADREENETTPNTASPAFEEGFAALKAELGVPFGTAYGGYFWKRGDGSAELLEKDGMRWHIKAGEPHRFGVHGRVITRYWTEQGFLDKESASKWLSEKKRLDPKEENIVTISHEPVGDIRGLVEEKLKKEAPYTMSAVERMRAPKKRERAAAAPTGLGAEEPQLGTTIAEVRAKLGEPQEFEGIPYWKRTDGTAVIFDAPSPGARKIPLILRPNGTHRFRGQRKKWSPERGFVDAE